MKNKILTIILTATVAIAANAQIVNIPDAAFKAYLVGRSDINTNGDNEIQVSEAQNHTGDILCAAKGISDLTGIEYFTNVTYLDCSDNSLTSIDVSQNTALEILYCAYNQLTNLDVSHNTNLTELDFSNNDLTNIDLSQNTALESLICVHSQLTTLDISHNTNLIELACAYNQLQNIDFSQNTALETVFCIQNLFISLDFSSNASLKYATLFGNTYLTDLNLANGNNANFLGISTTTNPDTTSISCPNLHCIKVDDVVYSETHWRNDTTQHFGFELQHLFYDDNNSCPYVAPTSITETLVNNKFAVYPNPTNGIIYFSETINLQLINAVGQKIADKKNVNSLNLSNQPTGIYFLTLTNDNGQIIKRHKIVKE